MDWSNYDGMVDIAGLQADIDKASSQTGDFEETPCGEYEVTVEKLELVESKKGDPMVRIWFKVAAGEQQGAYIFMNQLVTKGFQIHLVCELLRDMDINTIVDFDGYAQFSAMLEEVFKEIHDTKSFHLVYGENAKGFKTFEIKEVFNK